MANAKRPVMSRAFFFIHYWRKKCGVNVTSSPVIISIPFSDKNDNF